MNKPMDQHSIRALAYKLWERRGKPQGSADEDWLEAERQLMSRESAAAPASKSVDESVKQSFPASDPPGSRLPDEPPVNAEAKWAAAGVDRDELSRAIQDESQLNPAPVRDRSASRRSERKL
jgi:hypothetical protein